MMKKVREFLLNTLLLAAGNALCAFAVNGILIPQEFLSSGLTGVALIIFYKYPILPVGIIYLLVNIPVFFLGWYFINLRFVLYSAWGMIIYAAMLYIVKVDLGISDMMLAALIAGGITGCGVAVLLRSYGSAGGSEIFFVILNKFFSLTLGTSTVIINSIILAVSLVLFPLDKVLYTLVFIVASAYVTDIVFHGLAKRRAVLIISDRWKEISDGMTKGNKLGVTLIKGIGGYQGSEKTILYSVIRRKDIHPVKSLVMGNDPDAFIAILEAADVTGEKVGNQPHW